VPERPAPRPYRTLVAIDALWSALPMPVRTHAVPVQVGPVAALEMYRSVLGRPLMKVFAFRVGRTLVDTGLTGASRAVVDWARAGGAAHAILTHHHEDHAGNAHALAEAGVSVRATSATRRLLQRPLPLPFYEHLAWGKPPAASPDLLPTRVEIDGEWAEVIPAPGHCVDQVCLWMPSRGWCFSGDVFLSERVRLFRRDEDFAATVSSLRQLASLPIESLFCAHRPRVAGGQAALRAKLDHLLELEAQVRHFHALGHPPAVIVRDLRLPRGSTFERLSLGDASAENLVRSVLFGPRVRAEVQAALSAGG